METTKETLNDEHATQAETPDMVQAKTDTGDEVQQLREQLLRKAAEFENFRKRTLEEKAQMVGRANEVLLLELLPVMDDFERALESARPSHGGDPLFTGMELVYTKFKATLARSGATPMETIGTPFDVDFHDALMQAPSADHAPGTVIGENLRGYLYNGRVLRHAQVIVAAEPADAEKDGASKR